MKNHCKSTRQKKPRSGYPNKIWNKRYINFAFKQDLVKVDGRQFILRNN